MSREFTDNTCGDDEDVHRRSTAWPQGNVMRKIYLGLVNCVAPTAAATGNIILTYFNIYMYVYMYIIIHICIYIIINFNVNIFIRTPFCKISTYDMQCRIFFYECL